MPLGLPAAFTDPVEHAARRPGRRAMPRTHGPFLATAPAARLGAPRRARRRPRSRPWRPRAEWSAASSGPTASSASGATTTCCASCGGGRSPRCAARSSPSSPTLRAVPAGVARRRRGPRAASTRWSRCSGSCRARRSPASVLETDVLPAAGRRVPPARPRRAVHLGRCRVGRRRARSAPPTGASACSSATRHGCSPPRPIRSSRPTVAIHDALRDHLAQRGA